MAHYAKLDENNIVLEVNVVDNDQEEALGGEEGTVAWLLEGWGGADWKKTSYNTIHNTHIDGGTPFRGNYAGPGHIYDPDLDMFLPPHEEPFVLDVATASYVPPTPMPPVEEGYIWRFIADDYDENVDGSGWTKIAVEDDESTL